MGNEIWIGLIKLRIGWWSCKNWNGSIIFQMGWVSFKWHRQLKKGANEVKRYGLMKFQRYFCEKLNVINGLIDWFFKCLKILVSKLHLRRHFVQITFEIFKSNSVTLLLVKWINSPNYWIGFYICWRAACYIYFIFITKIPRFSTTTMHLFHDAIIR